MAQPLRGLVALAEDLGSVPSTHVAGSDSPAVPGQPKLHSESLVSKGRWVVRMAP